MKNLVLLLFVLSITSDAYSQSFSSDKFPKLTDYYDRIDLHDENGTAIVSVAPKFYKQKQLKEWLKPIKVDGKNYLIKRGKRGAESVYDENGKHVALISRKDATIHLVQENQKYSLKPNLKLGNFNVLECKDSEGLLVSTTSFNADRTLSYLNHVGQDPNLLLMSLCTHQYQELLLGRRGRLSSFSNDLMLFNLLDCE